MPRLVVTSASLALCLSALALLPSCPPSRMEARAAQVQSRAELIGGPRALGEVGDWLLENDKVRFIIQDQGFSRGFGVFGGALLDADLVRPDAGVGDSAGGNGQDNFGEMFPAFFLEALNPTAVPDPENPGSLLPAIEVEKTGGDGGEAVIIVRAIGDDFLAITQTINETALGDRRILPTFAFETRYILKPGAQHLEIETRIRNRSQQPVELPKELLGNQIPAPFGDVVLFGAGNKVFLPHEAGFDLRFRLEDRFAAGNIPLPAFPGLVAEFIASASPHVSYGVLPFPVEAPAQNFAFANRAHFPEAKEHSVHVPFIASAFTGLFQAIPPPVLEPDDGALGGADEFRVRRALIVGDGDIASISDVVYGLLGDETGTLQGRVAERQRPLFVKGASVVVLDDAGNKVTQAYTDEGGRFDAKLRPGHYQLVVVTPGADPSPAVGVDIAKDAITFEELIVDSPAEIVVTIVEKDVGPVPAKASLVGTLSLEEANQEPKKHLFDLSLAQPFLYTDLVANQADDPQTRRYLEAIESSHDGVVHLVGRPGRYRLVGSRGAEYTIAEQDVELVAGASQAVTLVIERVVDTSGYVGADFHLHSRFSLDSSAPVDDRIASYAAEGLELAVATDHNFVVDYQPVLQQLGLERFINTAVGLELTTIDRGHFNGFPLERGSGALEGKNEDTGSYANSIASRTHGSFQWALKTPDQIFAALRALGKKNADGSIGDVVVQVNHPRDSILGYFEQYGLDPETMEPEGITNPLLSPDAQRHPEFAKERFSFDFDAIEVFNGKRLELLRTLRVPADAPRLTVDGSVVTVEPVSCCAVQVGDLVRETAPRECRDGGEDCACDVDTFRFQLEQGNCGFVGDIAFPGVVEDWMSLLATGKRVVGTSNSDSHEPDKEEPGYPRTYIRVPVDEPTELRPEQIVDAFRQGDVLMTNGPFVRVTARGAGGPAGMGQTASAADGKVTLTISVDSAPWIKPDTLRVLQDGALVHEEAVAGAGRHSFEVELDVTQDGFVVVEVQGKESMFPVVFPNEIPPLQFTDIIGSLGSSFGLDAGDEAFSPDLLFVTSPYALTNPIWLDSDGDGEITPSRVLNAARASSKSASRKRIAGVMQQVDIPWVPTEQEAARAEWQKVPLRKRAALTRLPRWLWPSDRPTDVRRSLLQFVNHRE